MGIGIGVKGGKNEEFFAIGRGSFAAVNNFFLKKMCQYEIKLLYLHKISER